jgi:cold shock CspA family protein
MTGGGRLLGTVTAFDAEVGLGEVQPVGLHSLDQSRPGDDDTSGYRFHCTQIADGSRLIAAGTEVSFRLLPGRDGRWEAADLRPGRVDVP